MMGILSRPDIFMDVNEIATPLLISRAVAAKDMKLRRNPDQESVVPFVRNFYNHYCYHYHKAILELVFTG